jgi:hypothetical protein
MNILTENWLSVVGAIYFGWSTTFICQFGLVNIHFVNKFAHDLTIAKGTGRKNDLFLISVL